MKRPIGNFVGLARWIALMVMVVCAAPWTTSLGSDLQFAGRTWNIKESSVPVGPGGNRFSADPSDVWVDQGGLHLTISEDAGQWFSTEVIMSESLGYGTYAFQTNSPQDTLNPNATFGAFTWDPFGDDDRIPDFPNREIDFEDTRWGNPAATNNSQFVVQPYHVPGNLRSFALPDSDADPALTRILKWSYGRIEFIALQGHYAPDDFPQTAIIQQYVYEENLSLNHIVPMPGRENFRFNLWLNQDTPFGDQPVEVVINDFVYLPTGDFNGNGQYECQEIDSLVAQIVDVASGGSVDRAFDLTGDENVDADDLDAWLAEAGAAATSMTGGAPYLKGDANLDGTVDRQDFLIWNARKFTFFAAWCGGDFNADGMVDGQDLLAWNSNKFTSADGANPVPEPEAWLLLMANFLLCAACSRTRSHPQERTTS